ncbi:hypothetical protein BKA93DRAFT_824368 [Sparassis latifolia]|uniref:Uncharacterized protein n=1 Tax=Sparassis crispa TaxID=139825 RepID=A0A401GVP3_9APHY|nr:hypothetical protein SCP_0901760 [Sparassis crispa]GBE86297.1 hypothetical protein SCP_0901760 [Sparassis crispa]
MKKSCLKQKRSSSPNLDIALCSSPTYPCKAEASSPARENKRVTFREEGAEEVYDADDVGRTPIRVPRLMTPDIIEMMDLGVALQPYIVVKLVSNERRCSKRKPRR